MYASESKLILFYHCNKPLSFLHSQWMVALSTTLHPFNIYWNSTSCQTTGGTYIQSIAKDNRKMISSFYHSRKSVTTSAFVIYTRCNFSFDILLSWRLNLNIDERRWIILRVFWLVYKRYTPFLFNSDFCKYKAWQKKSCTSWSNVKTKVNHICFLCYMRYMSKWYLYLFIEWSTETQL